ncbi:hypothetical protein [Candidatus Leptofilum sp.]|uniref:hypothetical protein n=1 Tax=Candidatus Leptofilum sp. TaxID=3241576 RepID=UPI003B592AA6
MSNEPQENGQTTNSNGRSWRETLSNPAVLIASGIALVALLAVVVLSVILLQGSDDEGDDTAASGTPTPFTNDSDDNLLAGDSLVVGMSDSDTISVTVDVPITLSLPGQQFNVQTQIIGADGTWTPTLAADEAGTAVWVYGSIVNYVVGLPDSEANRTLLEGLAPGDEMMLATRGGTRFTFSFNERTAVPVTNRDIFAQNSPGITLVLLGSEGNERLVVNGRYVLAETDSPAGNVVSLGETAQLENVQITVNSTTYIADRPEIPAGFALFVVDYQIQNVGLTALDSGSLRLSLADNLGNQYVVSPIATQLGNFPTLTGFLNANQVTQASAGYQIPLGLESDTLSWIVTNSSSGAQVYVTLPFTGGSAAAGSAISLARVDVSTDLTSLILGGQVTNLGTQPIVISESDVALQTDDGSIYLLLSTNPPFPWTVPPGQTLQYFLTYQRPPTGTAVFRVLNQGFQLTNLR